MRFHVKDRKLSLNNPVALSEGQMMCQYRVKISEINKGGEMMVW